MTLTELFTNIANAIRTKKGTSDKILATNFATEIENLPSGGGEKIPITSAYYLCYKRDGLVEYVNNIFDFSECIDFRYMFYGYSLTTIPLLDTSKGIDFNYMFRDCEFITTIPQIDTSSGTSFTYMFYYCSKLTTIPQIDTSSGTGFSNMFDRCTSLTTIPLLDTSKGIYFNYMFYYCTSLTTIPLLDTSKGTNCSNMFHYCTSLTDIGGLLNIGKAFTQKSNNYSDYTIILSHSKSLTYDSLMNVINNLYDLNLTYNVANGGTLYTQKLVLGSTNTAKLTAEEIAIATAKGWTVS